MTITDLIASIGILVAVMLAWWQLRKANIQSRAQFIVDLFTLHTSDDEVLKILYKIEYQDWEFDETAFPRSKDERALDKLLYFFQQVSMLYEIGTIDRNDLKLIEYDFLRVYMDAEFQKYLQFLDRTPHGLPTVQADFSAYRRVANALVSEFEKRHGLDWKKRDGSTGGSETRI